MIWRAMTVKNISIIIYREGEGVHGMKEIL